MAISRKEPFIKRHMLAVTYLEAPVGFSFMQLPLLLCVVPCAWKANTF